MGGGYGAHIVYFAVGGAFVVKIIAIPRGHAGFNVIVVFARGVALPQNGVGLADFVDAAVGFDGSDFFGQVFIGKFFRLGGATGQEQQG